MRALVAMAVLSTLSGCLFTDMTYHALVKPDRPQRARELVACSVVEDGDEIRASVALLLDDGRRWLFDDGLIAVRDQPNEVRATLRLRGAAFDLEQIPRPTRRCVAIADVGDVRLGTPLMHFDPSGSAEPTPRPLDAEDYRHAALVLYRRADPQTLLVLVPPREGRDVDDVDDFLAHEQCLGCRRWAPGPLGAELLLPGRPSKGGLAGFVFLVPLLAVVDVLAGWEVASLCAAVSRSWDGCLGRNPFKRPKKTP